MMTGRTGNKRPAAAIMAMPAFRRRGLVALALAARRRGRSSRHAAREAGRDRRQPCRCRGRARAGRRPAHDGASATQRCRSPRSSPRTIPARPRRTKTATRRKPDREPVAATPPPVARRPNRARRQLGRPQARAEAPRRRRSRRGDARRLCPARSRRHQDRRLADRHRRLHRRRLVEHRRPAEETRRLAGPVAYAPALRAGARPREPGAGPSSRRLADKRRSPATARSCSPAPMSPSAGRTTRRRSSGPSGATASSPQDAENDDRQGSAACSRRPTTRRAWTGCSTPSARPRGCAPPASSTRTSWRSPAAVISVIKRSRTPTRRWPPCRPRSRRTRSTSIRRIQVLRRADKIEEAAALMLSAPRDPKALVDPDAWWVERRLISRALIDKGDAKTAYRIAAGHAAESPTLRAEAEFHAGWYALEYLGDPATAEKHFAAIASISTMPLSVSRAEYWLGRAAAAAGDAKTARPFPAGGGLSDDLLRPARARPPRQQAADAERAAGADAGPRPASPTRELVQVIQHLTAADAGDRADIFYRTLAETLTDPAEIALLAAMAEKERRASDRAADRQVGGGSRPAGPVAGVPDRGDPGVGADAERREAAGLRHRPAGERIQPRRHQRRRRPRPAAAHAGDRQGNRRAPSACPSRRRG